MPNTEVFADQQYLAFFGISPAAKLVKPFSVTS
jgi:hypothetical protein